MSKQGAPSIAPPQPGSITTAEPKRPEKDRRECHTVTRDGGYVCGLTRPGGKGGTGGLHSRAECIAKGHKHCQSCLALEELGLDGRRG